MPGEFTLPSKVVQASSILLDAQIDIDIISAMDKGTSIGEDTKTLECNNSDDEGFTTPPKLVLKGDTIQVREEPHITIWLSKHKVLAYTPIVFFYYI